MLVCLSMPWFVVTVSKLLFVSFVFAVAFASGWVWSPPLHPRSLTPRGCASPLTSRSRSGGCGRRFRQQASVGMTMEQHRVTPHTLNLRLSLSLSLSLSLCHRRCPDPRLRCSLQPPSAAPPAVFTALLSTPFTHNPSRTLPLLAPSACRETNKIRPPRFTRRPLCISSPLSR